MKLHYDIIIIGTGAAGLYTALSLPNDVTILMITKDALKNSDSYLAQGGISTLRNEEDYTSYFNDTMRAGRYENNKESVAIMIRESNDVINCLLSCGVDFDKDNNGVLNYTREGAHSAFRILHHKDVTGKEIVTKLLSSVQARENITICEYTTMIDLICDDTSCHGVVIETKEGDRTILTGNAIVLATGGIGGLFQNSTNFPHISGDSFALALKHHIELEHLNYIQIHPTVLYSKKKGRRFLISESVRGEGAILLNLKKERFVDELQPRDVVTNAILCEMEKEQSEYVYLSLNSMPMPQVQKRFPNIYKRCLEEGYTLGRDLIPVTPAQHYLMGGIKTDTNGKTSMAHLYAVGETACNGVHGANRLASNSLLESLVFAKRAANTIIKKRSEWSKVLQPPNIDLSSYPDKAQMKAEHRSILLQELKRRDEDFYAKWCYNEN